MPGSAQNPSRASGNKRKREGDGSGSSVSTKKVKADDIGQQRYAEQPASNPTETTDVAEEEPKKEGRRARARRRRRDRERMVAKEAELERIGSRAYYDRRAVDQRLALEAAKSQRAQSDTRQDQNGPPLAHGRPSIQSNEQRREISNGRTIKDKKAEKRAKKKERKQQRAREIEDDRKKSTERSNHVGSDSAEKRQRAERAVVKRAKRSAASVQHTDSKALIQQDQRIAQDITKEKPSYLGWTLTHPSAGRFLEHDPIFVRDENEDSFLISANNREIQVLSLETSLVSCTHPAPADKSVACYAVDALNDSILHIAYSDSSVVSWDWCNDFKPKDAFKAEGQILALTSTPPAGDDKAALFYLSVFRGRYAVFQEKHVLLHTTREQLESIQVLGSGEYVICRGPSVLLLGRKKNMDQSTTDFIWLEIPLSSTSTSLDTRVQPATSNKKGANQTSGLSLAIGNENGQIHLYEDVSSLFKEPAYVNMPTPRILHWHRESVSSVKFSRDGNYLISGGKETVLVIWQLETGKKQFLPHLTSEIERIVVNAEGDRYAVQMGDNSIMVLSTSELKPVAHFAGLQMESRSTLPERQSESDEKERGLAAALHPKHSNQLLLTVPSSQPKSPTDIVARPFLQTFDIRHSRHISRQALTRNNVTDFNLGPERTPIVPPDVVHLAISHDGMWLATVDEWMPPASDLEHLDADDTGIEVERRKRREVYLKFWHWSEQEGLWTLSTRVNSPHGRADGDALGPGTVFALETNPNSNGFATVGEDRCVRVWTPKKRRQDAELVEWRCKWVAQLPAASEPHVDEVSDGPSEVGEACLAFSEDGSLLAVSLTQMPANAVMEEAPIVHFVDTSSGVIASSKSGLARGEITALGFLERYLVVVSSCAAYVWDLVEDMLMYKVKLSSPSRTSSGSQRPLLAIDHDEVTFALVISRAAVQVYSPRQPKWLYKQAFETDIEAVLTEKGRRGYVIVFADASLRTISPVGASSQLRALPNSANETLTALEPPADAPALALEPAADVDEDIIDLTASSNKLVKDTEEISVRRGQDEEDDRPVVRPEQLASIFDVGHSFAMPPVKDMFQAVVGLYGRKPLRVASS